MIIKKKSRSIKLPFSNSMVIPFFPVKYSNNDDAYQLSQMPLNCFVLMARKIAHMRSISCSIGVDWLVFHYM